MKPTNLLFINADQHSRHVYGAYGNPVVKTPHLDGLAARGTLFANGYCPFPICVPSRASLATGRYAHTLGSWDNAKPYIGTEAPSWGHRLIEQGHEVTTIGKLHYRRPRTRTGFPDQRIPMHVLDGEGDFYGLLRPKMPPRDQRQYVTGAGPGEMEYTRYDRAIAEEAERYLRTEATGQDKPWALYVSFLHPHLPLVVPEEYFSLYPPDSLPLPTAWREQDWHRHPALDLKRKQAMLDEPFDEATLRRAMAAYYGMVTFLDDQVGRVLQALDDTGLRDSTRIIYTADHGEMLGAHGLWWKNCMYEESAGVPVVVAGPDIPEGKVSQTPVNAIDCFPAIVEAVGATLAPEDADLPGRVVVRPGERARPQPHHLLRVPRQHVAERRLHDPRRPLQAHLLRRYEPQLFDLVADPGETRDLAADTAYADARAACEAKLRQICDPEEVDRRAKADQQARIDAAGGTDAVIAAGVRVPYTPAPDQFDPAPVEARERARALKTARAQA